jgi:hypothetical protein
MIAMKISNVLNPNSCMMNLKNKYKNNYPNNREAIAFPAWP